MKTYSVPSRGSTQSAVRMVPLADAKRAGGPSEVPAGDGPGGRRERGRGADGIGRAGQEHDRLGAGAQRVVRGQRRQQCARVAVDHLGMVGLARPGKRVERQAIAHRRSRPGRGTCGPLGGATRRSASAPSVSSRSSGRAYPTIWSSPWLNTRRSALALHLVLQPGVEGIDVDGQPPLAPEVVPDVLVARLHVRGRHAEPDGERPDEARRVCRAVAAGARSRRRRARGRSTWARRRGASRRRAPSAGAARPDTTCPGRSARSRWRRSASGAGGAARPRARAWSGRARPCSTRRRPGPRRRRTSARPPW